MARSARFSAENAWCSASCWRAPAPQSRTDAQTTGDSWFAHKPELAATMLSEVALVRGADDREVGFSNDVLERARAVSVQVPEGGVARGIPRVPPRAAPRRDEALALGLAGAYLAPVEPEDCDAHGAMEEAAFMARVSDGIGHFFETLRNERGAGIGGAALEYRYVFHERPRAGDLIEVRSGLNALGNKTFHICHWVFDVETGRCAATSEAVAVSFDLAAQGRRDPGRSA